MGAIFFDAFAKWSAGNLQGSIDEMVRIEALHPDWWELLRASDGDPPGFVDMMVEIDPATDEWIVNRNPLNGSTVLE